MNMVVWSRLGLSIETSIGEFPFLGGVRLGSQKVDGVEREVNIRLNLIEAFIGQGRSKLDIVLLMKHPTRRKGEKEKRRKNNDSPVVFARRHPHSRVCPCADSLIVAGTDNSIIGDKILYGSQAVMCKGGVIMPGPVRSGGNHAESSASRWRVPSLPF